MSNFNQIVIQDGIINKYFVSFDLPVYQLSNQSVQLTSNTLRHKEKTVNPPSNLWNLLEEYKKSSKYNKQAFYGPMNQISSPPLSFNPYVNSADSSKDDTSNTYANTMSPPYHGSTNSNSSQAISSQHVSSFYPSPIYQVSYPV